MESENINPWVQIWIRPKRTMRSILDTDPKRIIIWLAIISGILAAFGWIAYSWIAHPEKESTQNIIIIIATLIAGALGGIINLYFGGWLYKLTGSWIGGTGSYTDVRAAVGWSNYPFILANIISLFSFWAMPNPWLQGTVGLIYTIIGIWGIVIFLNLLGEAHRFSAWKALLAVIIAAILFFVAIMIISLLTPLLTPLFY